MNGVRFLMGALAITALAVADRSFQMARANPAELKTVMAGACQDCSSDSTKCVDTTCTANGEGKWLAKVGTKITVQTCPDVAKDADGYDKCSPTAKQDCHTHKDCTDSACKNCTTITTPDDDKFNTNCSTSGGRKCKGT